MNLDQWRNLLNEWFAVPGHPGVYILGCYARYLTLYSQQIRALNLVAALSETGKVSEGTRVAIIGAGAGGLTAAVAAATLKANVTVLEKSEGVMEIQRNNRQRWIHPHIYDWPNVEGKYDYTVLPFLGWRAAYSENVAAQIVDGWERIRATLPSLKSLFTVEIVAIEAANDGSVLLNWNGPGGGQGYFDVVLLSVGFGLERMDAFGNSYWAEDDLDSGFRSFKGQKWLISGFGDGGLTDLMRLCIRRFRHAEVASWFGGAKGIDGVKNDLAEILKDPRASDASFLTERFNQLQTPGLENVLESRLRRSGPTAYLTGKSNHFYGPGSSVLNRLILLVLKRLDCWQYRPGPTGEIARTDDGRGYQVELGPAKTKELFDRVIKRHGPEPALAEPPFNQLWASSSALKARWDALPRDRDRSRVKLWSHGFFGPESSPRSATADELADAYAAALAKYQIRVKAMLVRADVRDNGNCKISFRLDGLEILHGKLSGLHFSLEFAAGCIGPPEIDEDTKALGLAWDQIPAHPAASVSEAVDQGRKFSNTLRFPAGRELPANCPITITVSFTVLNGTALTAWEFNQLYREDERVHMNSDPLARPMEFVARMVWFPVENLKLQITLPERVSGMDRTGQSDRQPFATFFHVPGADRIAREEVVRDSILHLGPAKGSPWSPETARWNRDWSGSLVEAHHVRYDINEGKWEFSVDKPPVGSCCSLDWDLPPIAEAGKPFQAIEKTLVSSDPAFYGMPTIAGGVGTIRPQPLSASISTTCTQPCGRDFVPTIRRRCSACRYWSTMTIAICWILWRLFPMAKSPPRLEANSGSPLASGWAVRVSNTAVTYSYIVRLTRKAPNTISPSLRPDLTRICSPCPWTIPIFMKMWRGRS
jgi:hypothetical protein